MTESEQPGPIRELTPDEMREYEGNVWTPEYRVPALRMALEFFEDRSLADCYEAVQWTSTREEDSPPPFRVNELVYDELMYDAWVELPKRDLARAQQLIKYRKGKEMYRDSLLFSAGEVDIEYAAPLVLERGREVLASEPENPWGWDSEHVNFAESIQTMLERYFHYQGVEDNDVRLAKLEDFRELALVGADLVTRGEEIRARYEAAEAFYRNAVVVIRR